MTAMRLPYLVTIRVQRNPPVPLFDDVDYVEYAYSAADAEHQALIQARREGPAFPKPQAPKVLRVRPAP